MCLPSAEFVLSFFIFFMEYSLYFFASLILGRLTLSWCYSALCSVEFLFSVLTPCLVVCFSNSLDPDQARQMSGLIWIQTV